MFYHDTTYGVPFTQVAFSRETKGKRAKDDKEEEDTKECDR